MFGNIPQGTLAHRLPLERHLRLDLVVSTSRNGDSTSFGKALQARRDIHAVIVDSVAVNEVDPWSATTYRPDFRRFGNLVRRIFLSAF
jgi:hypothetical protein